MDIKHEILQDLKRVALELGRCPSRDEYCSKLGRFSKPKIDKVFGGWTLALQASGLSKAIRESSVIDHVSEIPVKDFKYTRAPFQGHIVNRIDLDDLFRRAGNPESLKVLAQPDTHVQDIDERAHAVFLEFGAYWKPHVHMIMGDFMHVEGLSPWPQSQLNPRRIVTEALKARELLSLYRKSVFTSAIQGIFIEGNHEDWISQFLISGENSRLFDGIESLGLEINTSKILDLKGHGYEFFPVNQIVSIGKANFTHGYYTGGSHAKKHLEVLKASIYYGHTHDVFSYNSTSLTGPVESHALGCLCRLDPSYLNGKPNNWVHAFGVFEFFPDGTYTFYCPRIINGRMSYNGKVFKA